MKEIERKFLVDPMKLPFLPGRFQLHEDAYYIKQFYLTEPGSKNSIRFREVREVFNSYKSVMITIKGPGLLEREEVEIPQPLSGMNVPALEALAQGSIIEKTRRYVRVGDHRWAVDHISKPREMWLAEVELKSPDEAFELPTWIAEEVTGDVSYYGHMISQTKEP